MRERKYKIKDGQIVKRSDGTPIPEDEPIFIFRAKDRKALAALVGYSLVLDHPDQRASVQKSINDFREFLERNPESVKEPRP